MQVFDNRTQFSQTFRRIFVGCFNNHRVDGRLLLKIDEPFVESVLLVKNPFLRRKLLGHLLKLRAYDEKFQQVRSLPVLLSKSFLRQSLDCAAPPYGRR